MQVVKEIKQDGFVLTHSWYTDHFGFQRNSFDLFHEETCTHYPFMGKLRVNNYDRNTPIGGDDVSPYSEEEYQEMLKGEVGKINDI